MSRKAVLFELAQHYRREITTLMRDSWLRAMAPFTVEVCRTVAMQVVDESGPGQRWESSLKMPSSKQFSELCQELVAQRRNTKRPRLEVPKDPEDHCEIPAEAVSEIAKFLGDDHPTILKLREQLAEQESEQ